MVWAEKPCPKITTIAHQIQIYASASVSRAEENKLKLWVKVDFPDVYVLLMF